MPNFKVLIVDDERLSRRRIRRLLTLEPDCDVLGECANGKEAVAMLEASSPDILFLELVRVDERAHRAVKNHDLAREQILESFGRVIPSHRRYRPFDRSSQSLNELPAALPEPHGSRC